MYLDAAASSVAGSLKLEVWRHLGGQLACTGVHAERPVMTIDQRARLQLFLSQRWVFKLVCLVVAVPLVLGVFTPILGAAQGMYG